MAESRSMLWWGRFDPDYSRNRIVRQLLQEQGWQLRDFYPANSSFGDLQATVQRVERPDVVWVPCFRQRDMAAAARWARRYRVPLVFDPLISAYDKQVEERKKFDEGGRQAKQLLGWEQDLFARADRVVADTQAHADYFHEVLAVPRERISVVMVGAETNLFRPCPERPPNDPIEVLFYGSFIPLQGPEIIVEAARLCKADNINWTLLGDGPLRPRCEELARGSPNVHFEDWLPYERLPERICQADILLGIFGSTPKAGRVIPNKVFQGLSCGKPMVTRYAASYPKELLDEVDSGITWVPPDDPQKLKDRVVSLAEKPGMLREKANCSRQAHASWFSRELQQAQLQSLLSPFDGAYRLQRG